MTIEDVLNLSKSGFTADEIKKFMGFNGVTTPTKPNDTKPNDTKPDDTKPNDTKPNDTKPNDTKPNDTKPEEVFKDSLSALSKEISDLKKTMQATNILNSNGTPPERESVNDILKSIINPTFENKGDVKNGN